MTMDGAIAAGLLGPALLFAPAADAQTGVALFAADCSGCHNDVNHPRALVYNAAGNAAIIEAVNARGMGAAGSLADHESIAAYLDSVKPTISMAPVPHDSTGTRIPLRDIIVSAAETHASLKIIANIVTVSPPTRGTVTYGFAGGFGLPSSVTYTPFPGQSGIDSWTYRGVGTEQSTTIRAATVNIANADGTLTVAPDANQHGLTGSWYEPATSGQGFEVEIFPNLHGAGRGFTQVSWFTFDTKAGGADGQRWYTLSGEVPSGASNLALTIYRNVGGNFNAGPVTAGQAVGTATLVFSNCTSGQLTYAFTDGTGRAGTIPLTRLTQNMTCVSAGPAPTSADFALSGNWYDPATSGQGLTIEANPASNVLFLAWYTYAPNGAAAGEAGQRWDPGRRRDRRRSGGRRTGGGGHAGVAGANHHHRPDPRRL